MTLYTVKYKKLNSLLWKCIKRVKGDGIVEHGKSRWLILDTEERIEIPCRDTVFKFSKERYFACKERMEQETGQAITVNKR